MKRGFIHYLLIGIILLGSCGKTNRLTEKMDRIRNIGDEDPLLAIAMLDSLNTTIRDEPKRVIMKYDLLRLRLQDKAYITATSDIVAKQLVLYYEKYGSMEEKQEAYYYAGSVYRDLQDTPRALEYFLKSMEIAETHTTLSPLMLRNTYSNLCFLCYRVQDYQRAYDYSLKEYNYSKQAGKTDMASIMHMGDALRALDRYEAARETYTLALDTIMSTPQLQDDTETLCGLLFGFSYLRDKINATKCHNLLERQNGNHDNRSNAYDEDNGIASAYALYYDLIGNTDSAIHYYRHILHNESNLTLMYDASKALFQIYHEKNNLSEADRYANLHLHISDSIDLGKRQELAATVNNEFQYHLDKNEEQHIMEESNKFRFLLTTSIFTTLLTLLMTGIFIIHRRNKHLKELLAISDEINRHKEDKKMMLQEISRKEQELVDSKEQLGKKETELERVKKQLSEVNAELDNYDMELKEKEHLLSEKMEQNKMFLNLLHQSELEGKAEDVIKAIRQSSSGKRNMQTTDWKQLYKAVDDLHPSFKNQLLKELGAFTEQQMQVCYLMRIGLSKPQIQNMTNLSRATVWRWTKKFEWVRDL